MLRRRTTTPVRGVDLSGSDPGLTGDLTLQTCRRVGAVGAVAAGLWSYSLLFNGVVAPMLGRPPLLGELWPHPAVLVDGIGLGASLLVLLVSRRLRHRPQLLLDLSAGFAVLSALLVGILNQWMPAPITPRISWLCVIILVYPAIVPTPPLRTLGVSLLAASMDPLALTLSSSRGVAFDHSWFYYLWSFVPAYLCAFIAVVPSRIIRSLGQQVSRARAYGSYQLEEALGRGGMGEVYRASHRMLARPAAVKVIRGEVLGGPDQDRARVLIERFRREAQASASLRSPHTINLYDFGVAQDGTFFLVMELLEGLDLQTLVERFGPQQPERAVYLLCQACESLEEAHARGLIHRDVKPSNIFSCRMGLAVDFVKVLDFGLVKARDESAAHQAQLTAPEVATGTPAYLAPEAVLGTAVDHRVDIYALGCVAYWLLTGHLVFEARSPVQLLVHHAQDAPVPPSQRVELEISPALDEVVLACLAKKPADRPQSAGELGRRLAAAVAGAAWTQERAQRWWQLHHPELARPRSIHPDRRILTKAGMTGSDAEDAVLASAP
jgi:serine/threonine-protein kinase